MFLLLYLSSLQLGLNTCRMWPSFGDQTSLLEIEIITIHKSINPLRNEKLKERGTKTETRKGNKATCIQTEKKQPCKVIQCNSMVYSAVSFEQAQRG